MNNRLIENNFLNLSQAERILSYGFDEPCIAYFSIYEDGKYEFKLGNPEIGEQYVLAPLLRPAVEWLHKKFGVTGEVMADTSTKEYKYGFVIHGDKTNVSNLNYEKYTLRLNNLYGDSFFLHLFLNDKYYYDTYEEAKRNLINTIMDLYDFKFSH